MDASETGSWEVGFYISFSLLCVLVLICGFLMVGRPFKNEARQNTDRFVEVLKHQAELWKQERGKREQEYELRLEEQRRKNAAWEQNSELRDDMNDVMEENRLLDEQKVELTQRCERLELEIRRLMLENAELKLQMARIWQSEPESGPDPDPETVVERETAVEPETERPRSKVRFSPTLIGSGLPPGSTVSLEDAVKSGLDSPRSDATFPSVWSESDAGTPSRTALPLSPPDNHQLPGTSKPMSSMVTMGGLLPGPSQRKTWTGEPVPPLPDDNIWKPVSPSQHRPSSSG